MRPRPVLVGLAAVALLTTLGACTSSGGGGSSGGSGFTRLDGRAQAPAAAASSADGGSSVGTTGGGSGGTRSASGNSDTTPAHLSADDIASAKIRNVEMTVQVRRDSSVSVQATRAEAIAAQAGGEVDADDRTSGRDARAVLLLRIPPTELVDTLAALSRLGSEKSRHFSSQDVTAQVADVASRVASARVSIARLRQLYGQASKVTDVITLEEELSTRESDLESLEAQQRALGAQTATAAVTITLTSPPIVAPVKHTTPHHHRSGFVGGLQNGWDAFTRGAAGVATFVGAVLPFAVLALLIAVLGRWAWPRLRPRRVTPTAE